MDESGSVCWYHPGMRCLTIIATLMALLMPVAAYAKRAAPPNVDPVIYEGVRYVAPNDDGRRAYVQAWDTKTDKMLWEVMVFRNSVNLSMEADVQWVFIKRMRIADGELIVIAEDDQAYTVDLKTRFVTKLKQVPPDKP